MAKSKRELNAEINLVSFISLLSVCICFLLLTAVWIQIGSLNVKQAVGGQSSAETQPQASLWAHLGKNGSIEVRVERAPSRAKRLAMVKIKGFEGKPDFAGFAKHIQQVRTEVPSLNMALVVPDAESVYEDIVRLMDKLKQAGILDLGVSPL